MNLSIELQKRSKRENKNNVSNTVYTVKTGDTLWAIATKNGTSVSKLESLNPGLTSDINPGDIIYLS